MEYLFIYTLQLTDAVEGLNILALVVFFAVAFAKIGIVIANVVEGEDEQIKGLNPIINKTLIITISIIVITFLSPTKQTLLLWGGTYYGKQTINQVVNSEKYKKISELIDLKLDNLIKEEKGNK